MHSLLCAITLHRYWRFRWYHAVMMWVWLLALAWGASPYLMVYVVGMPEPGSAPRYTGTIRVEGKFQYTKFGSKPPKYFIRTDKGEVEFHCGYLPRPRDCSVELDIRPEPGEVFVIGFDPYWGVDYIKFPPALARFDGNGLPSTVSDRRLWRLGKHQTNALMFLAGLLGYALLVGLAYRRTIPNLVRGPDGHLKITWIPSDPVMQLQKTEAGAPPPSAIDVSHSPPNPTDSDSTQRNTSS